MQHVVVPSKAGVTEGDYCSSVEPESPAEPEPPDSSPTPAEPATSGGTSAGTPATTRPWAVRFRDSLGWVGRHIITLITAVGVALYAVSRLSAVLFYRPFGVYPEEVGLGYAEILGRSLYTLAGVGVIFFLIRLVSDFVLLVIPRTWARLGKKERPPLWQHYRQWSDATSLSGALTTILTFALVFSLFMSDESGWAAYEDGTPQAPVFAGFSWQAQAAWALVGNEPPACVLYLGHADGVTVLFYPDSKLTRRLATSDVQLTTGRNLLPDEGTVPNNCGTPPPTV